MFSRAWHQDKVGETVLKDLAISLLIEARIRSFNEDNSLPERDNTYGVSETTKNLVSFVFRFDQNSLVCIVLSVWPNKDHRVLE